jgi:hypothetical protein
MITIRTLKEKPVGEPEDPGMKMTLTTEEGNSL